MLVVRQSTARTVTVGPVLDADGVAVTDGVVGDLKISKNGAAPAALNGSATLTHRHTGHYSLALTASDLDTVGQAEVVMDDTVNACAPKELTVIEEAIYDALFVASANAFSGAAGSTTLTALASGSITAAVIATDAIDADAIADNAIDAGAIAADAITAAKIADGAIDAATFATGAITAAAIAADAIGASELAADAVAEIADAVWDEDATGHQTTGTFGQAIGDPVADTNTIYAAVVTGAAGATIAADIVDIEGKVDDLETRLGTPSDLGGGATVAANLADIEAQTDDIGAAGAGLTAIPNALVLLTGTVANASTTDIDLGSLSFGDDELYSHLIRILDVSTGEYHARWIISFDSASDEATLHQALPFTTESGVDTFAVYAIRRDMQAADIANNAITAAAIAADAITAAKVAPDVHQEQIELSFTYDATATYAGADAGSLVKQIADNAGGSALTTDAIAEALFTYDATATYGTANAGSVVKQIADNAGGSALTEAGIADAVWDEARAGHTSAGSFGQGVASVQGNVTGSVASVATGGIAAASFAAGAIDAAAIATDAIGANEFAQAAADKVWSTAARVLTAGTNIQLPSNGLANVTAWTVNLTGSLSGSVGSVTGAVGSVTAAVTVGTINAGVITATSIAADAITDAKVASDVTIASVTGAVGSVTGAVGSVTGSVGGNVTGSVGSVATGGIVAASFAAGAIDAAAIAADAIGSSELAASAVAEIQSGLSTLDAAGVRTAVGLASANLDTQLAAISAFLDTEIAAILAAVDTEVGAIKTVTDQLVAAQAEPSAVPAANATPLAKIAWLGLLARNRLTQTSTTQTAFADNGSTTVATATHSDDGSEHVRGKFT